MPVTMSGYGQSYMPMGGPGVGAAIYGAQRQEVNFARMVELQKLNLQKRALRQQAAAQAAQLQQREQARQDELAMQQTRFDLEERKLDMQDAETQQRRQDILDAYERAAQEKSQRDAQALQDEKNKLTSVGATEWDGQGERPKQYYTMRDGTVYDLSGVDMGKVRGASSPQAANPDVIRKEMNELSKLGARPLSEGETFDTRTHYTHIGADGRVWLVQRTDGKGNPIVPPEKQAKPSPVEGYDSEEEYQHYWDRYGEEASNPQMAGKLKQIDLNLKNKARQLGVVEVVAKPGEEPKEEWREYSLEKLRDLANTEKKAQADAKLAGKVKTPWQDELKKAEAMVELHDAYAAFIHVNDKDWPDTAKAKKKYEINQKSGPIANGRLVTTTNPDAKSWEEHGVRRYAKEAEKRYQRALKTAIDLGWPVMKDGKRRSLNVALINGMYSMLMPSK